MDATVGWTLGAGVVLLGAILLLTRGAGTVHTVPPVPTGLTILAIGDTTLTIGWKADPGSTSFQVSLGGGGALTVTGTQATLTGLTPGTAYTIGVAACNSAGCSAPASLHAATVAPPPVPGAPTGLAASSVTNSSFVLSWQPVAGATQYTPYLDGVAQAPVDGVTYSVMESGLQPLTTYHASVSATGPGGTSPPSAPIAVSTPLL